MKRIDKPFDYEKKSLLKNNRVVSFESGIIRCVFLFYTINKIKNTTNAIFFTTKVW